MSNFILDTSVAVSWYIEEVFSESARHYQTQLINNQNRFYAVFIQLALLTGFPLLTAEKKTRGWVSKLGDLAVVIA